MAATTTMQWLHPSCICNAPQLLTAISPILPHSGDPVCPMYSHSSLHFGQGFVDCHQPHRPVQQSTTYGQRQTQQGPHQMERQRMTQYFQWSQQVPRPDMPSQCRLMANHSLGMKTESSQQEYMPVKQDEPPQPFLPPQEQQALSMGASRNLPHTPALSQSSVQMLQTLPAPPTWFHTAPGPIPATTPLVVKQDESGKQWIAFEYSRDRIRIVYTIRCDVESVNTHELSNAFKTDNCVYPRATLPIDQYKGNRLRYESDCNQVGWALAKLNPCLHGKRGLIQRAVDSWRNTNQDCRLQSRRFRRQAKCATSEARGFAVNQAPRPYTPGSARLPGQASMSALNDIRNVNG